MYLSNRHPLFFFFFFFNDTATTEIYTLSLHDALPIYRDPAEPHQHHQRGEHDHLVRERSEEHTSELQSPCNLVCRLLLEKKKKNINHIRLTKDNVSSEYGYVLLSHNMYVSSIYR